MDKNRLRKQIRALKASLTDDERERQSRAVCQQVTQHPRWMAARTVLLYSALPDEVDTQLLIKTAQREGKRILLPVVVGDVLELREYRGAMKEGAFGILEPVADGSPFTDYDSIDLAIIPGMAFDANGHRLGRGKGFYDKLLCQCPSLFKMGICFDFQLLPEIPCEGHDIKMSEVISRKQSAEVLEHQHVD